MEITGARTCAAAELVLQLEGDCGPADDMQGYGWALLVGPEDAWDLRTPIDQSDQTQKVRDVGEPSE